MAGGHNVQYDYDQNALLNDQRLIKLTENLVKENLGSYITFRFYLFYLKGYFTGVQGTDWTHSLCNLHITSKCLCMHTTSSFKTYFKGLWTVVTMY